MGEKRDKDNRQDEMLKRDDRTPPEKRPARDKKIDEVASDSDWRNKQ